MAHFARLNENNIVTQVVVVHNNELLDNGIESEQKGINFLKSLFGQDTIWKQTSYNTRKGKYYNSDNTLGDQSKAFRKNYAGVGYFYNQQLDGFISEKPYSSWILNESTCSWEAPVPYPGNYEELKPLYLWNEDTQSWILVENI